MPNIRYETNIPRKQANNFVDCLFKNLFILFELIKCSPCKTLSCMVFETTPDGNKSSFAAVVLLLFLYTINYGINCNMKRKKTCQK